MQTSETNRIRVEVCAGRALVWDLDDLKVLRTKHRIIGAMVGSLEAQPLQNIFYGMPLALLPEEVCLLQKHSLIHITNTDDGTGWNYPQNAKERDRCTVFEHLWAKGYYVTCGTKFGGDFLVYPGDPARYHSHYVVTVVQEDVTFDPRSLVATGRLGSNVKKTQVKACVSKETVRFWSVQWAAI